MIKLLELFGGIGSPRMATENLNLEIKSIDYVEILPYAVTAYNRMFDHLYKPQDVRDWNLNVDLLVHGSPCQDWSKNGKNDISTGRSILFERTLQIIEHELHPRPKVVIWENVTGLVSKKHVRHFEHYISTMEQLGYSNSFKILNSSNYGMAQNRDRIFTVSILGDEDLDFEFPKEKPLTKFLNDYIDRTVNPSDYALSENELSLFFERDGQLYIRENTIAGERLVEEGDSINVEFPTSKTRRGRVQKGMVPTLTTSPQIAVYYDGILRKITPLECWRLMGYKDVDFNRVANDDMPVGALYKLAGNSIVVGVLEAILEALINQGFLIPSEGQLELIC
ncbi:cytosine methyltransferase [Lysinibacillus sphaericus]|uniref:DNA (cytosine-5-)-methyltransferase n=1 Tax=Lysinibacillus sphaericus TaxID=1421 RepID=UPI0018CDBA24|nr:DNA (cytosine-5-)-methyltransferase [Lysinibacillus sphaericus]MBG9732254.1 cytosine methyltransferase [Lysinibacillus sphaericus]